MCKRKITNVEHGWDLNVEGPTLKTLTITANMLAV